MQSNKVHGLYFAGEVLDIDGITGGFNFQAAWTTGYIAGLDAGGDFGYDLPQNFPGPAASGNYTISVNFVTGKFSVQ